MTLSLAIARDSPSDLFTYQPSAVLQVVKQLLLYKVHLFHRKTRRRPGLRMALPEKVSQ